MALPPATLSESPCSEGSKNYIRNVEAEGSSPFTSTKGPGQRPKVGSPRKSDSPARLYVSLRVTPHANSGPRAVGTFAGIVRSILGADTQNSTRNLGWKVAVVGRMPAMRSTR